MRAADVPDMVRADDGVRGRTAVIVGRPNANCDPRHARHRLEPSNDLRWMKRTLEAVEARREIRDAENRAVGAREDRLDDRSVADVAPLARLSAHEG